MYKKKNFQAIYFSSFCTCQSVNVAWKVLGSLTFFACMCVLYMDEKQHESRHVTQLEILHKLTYYTTWHIVQLDILYNLTLSIIKPFSCKLNLLQTCKHYRHNEISCDLVEWQNCSNSMFQITISLIRI